MENVGIVLAWRWARAATCLAVLTERVFPTLLYFYRELRNATAASRPKEGKVGTVWRVAPSQHGCVYVLSGRLATS